MGKLNSEDYIRLGLCLPDCQDCATGPGYYVKNDKMVKNNLLLNNQLGEDKLQSHQAPLKKIVNNLANTNSGPVSDNNNNNTTCNPCKESHLSSQLLKKKVADSCSSSHCTKPRTGVVNLAFVESLTEQSRWYQPHL